MHGQGRACRNEMQRKAWLKEDDCALQRKTKLQQSSKLEDAHFVADAEMTVENRSSLAIGLSGQVPLGPKLQARTLSSLQMSSKVPVGTTERGGLRSGRSCCRRLPACQLGRCRSRASQSCS